MLKKQMNQGYDIINRKLKYQQHDGESSGVLKCKHVNKIYKGSFAFYLGTPGHLRLVSDEKN
jgi:hypothetical protein